MQVGTVKNPTLAPPPDNDAAATARRLGLGLGLGLGLPALLAAAFAAWWFKFRQAVGDVPADAGGVPPQEIGSEPEASPLAPQEQQMQTQT